MSYWDAYELPIPIRHYWISRFNKHKERASGTSDVNQPLSKTERLKFLHDAQKASNQPVSPPKLDSLMGPRRNQK